MIRTRINWHAKACIEPLESRRLLSTTFYVSPRGNDANPGIDLAHAWRTIQEAMNAATPGSTVLVEPGTYNQKLVVNVSGNATDGFITFQAVGRATINGRGIAGADLIYLNHQSYVQIVGFNLVNDLNVSDGSAIDLTGSDDHVSILNNLIHNITGVRANAIRAYGVDPTIGISNLVIAGNQIYQCDPAPSETVTLDGNVHDFQVANNFLHDCNNIGIDCIGGEGICTNPAEDFAHNGTISGNRVTRMHYHGAGREGVGIGLDGSRNIVVEQNTCWADDVGIMVGAVHAGTTASGNTIRDNYVFNNNEPGISIGATDTTGGLVTGNQVLNNTLFHDGIRDAIDGELRLQYGSGNLIENNLIDASRKTLLINSEYGSDQNTSDYNLFYIAQGPAAATFAWGGVPFSGFATYPAASRQDPHSIFANPLLLSPGSFRPVLSRRSPAINAGNPSFVPGAAETDFFGNVRLLGTAVDIGAVEAG
jgi:parallel beta-helix repeat protein